MFGRVEEAAFGAPFLGEAAGPPFLPSDGRIAETLEFDLIRVLAAIGGGVSVHEEMLGDATVMVEVGPTGSRVVRPRDVSIAARSRPP